MHPNQLAKIVVNCAFEIHQSLGPGLLESVYEEILCHELTASTNLQLRRQAGIPTVWKGVSLGIGFRADIIVENQLLIEVKSIDQLNPVHFKQVLTYLKLTDLHLALLINFNEVLIRNGIKRIVNNLPEKQ
ncbi:MAG: GxxExxY protein [Chitinophagaceae bacterium]|nr:GxxExxY protein [Chitinophagaceae bacterium]